MTILTNGPGPEPEDPHELLAAWALDAVDDRERALVERAIETDPELAAEARGLLETTALLAGSVAAAPPPALRGDVLALIASEAEASEPPLASPTETRATARHAAATTAASTEPVIFPVTAAAPTPRRYGAARWQRFALAAVVAGAIAVPSTLAVQNDQRASQAEQQVSALETALREPGATLVQGEVAGGGRAAAVLTGGEAVFTASDLPDPGDDRDYQLWRADGDVMVSAGVLTVHDGRVTTTVSADIPVEVLAVSIEPDGGSTAPTTDPVLVLAAS
ncbi:hypothetical protein C8046_15205 [Serinibacter arcticus]|uniref:Regulator of SigK n=1 Tax=Serinibacter arcticus TaxID=1655435 RepID=A0A2U1ZXZ8_9MICO|nr:anti-sigma factor [Serinibacter arcticus]PWD51792.1 hypothetical protein C8046_15205 [Serinibacter arcticus]